MTNIEKPHLKDILLFELDYVKEFNCICSKCEDTCCSNWNINISKEDYKKYKSNYNDGMNVFQENNIQKTPLLRRKKNMYAVIKLNKEKLCVFLNENNLCKIHLNYGADFLSNTCDTFPRITTKFGNTYETTLSLACPEAARVVLLGKHTFEFEKKNYENRTKLFFSNQFKGLDNKIFFKTRKYFYDIRDFTVKILKRRDFQLWERLCLLGAYYREITNLARNKQHQIIPDYSQSFFENIKLILENTKKNQSIEKEKEVVCLLKDILLVMKKNNNNKVFTEVINNTFKALEFDELEDDNTFLVKYNKLMKDKYDPFTKEFPHIMENFMLNYIYLFQFPFKTAVSINDYYLILMVQFSILKVLIAGNININLRTQEETSVEVLYSFSRLFLHTEYLMKIILINLRIRNLHNLGSITIMLKEESE